MSQQGSGKPRRSYRPTVEALEALRLFSGAVPGLPEVAVQHEFLPPTATEPPVGPIGPQGTGAGLAWDEALDQTRPSEILAASALAEAGSPASGPLSDGLAQLDRYLGRTWARAGLPPYKHDDCSQAVYLTLLENLGRRDFDRLVGEVGRVGVREVFSRETNDGPDFFRAIDMVKKRAQRERSFQPIDELSPPAEPSRADEDWRETIAEAIDRALNPREAALMQATLAGQTPAEIAESWGVAPKTVSNEKTRAFQKLREFLVADLLDN